MTSAKDIKMAVNGPVLFLIQEQAKSVAAIQALQTRMAVLESLQERLALAIEQVNQHLASSTDSKNRTLKCSSRSRSSPSSTIDKKLRFVQSESAELSKADSPKSDSLNKDSGIGASDSSLPPTEESKSPSHQEEDDDELLHLLDLIDRRSLALLHHVEEAGASGTSKFMETTHDSTLLDTLLFEKVDAQRQLSEVKAERDELRQRLAKLELATEAVNKQKLKVQKELDYTLQENQSLQDKIHKSSECNSKCESLGYLEDIARANIRRKYLQYSEKSRLKVSSILKEVSVLELQKQLLTYVMENDILRAKLQQDEPSKLSSWLKIESKLKKELREAIDAKHKIQELLQSRDLEIASLKDKVRLLEEGESDTDSCVKNFGMGSIEDWREPGTQNVYNKRTNLAIVASPFSPLGYGDFSKTQSLPAMLLKDAKSKLKERESNQASYNHAYDTGSFMDVPLNHSTQTDQNHSSHLSASTKDLVDLSSPMEHNFSSTSTLVQSHYRYQPTLTSGLSAPNLSGRSDQDHLQNWCFAVPKKSDTSTGAKLVNGHLCWKGPSRHLSEDISSICTEFDPLSDDTPSCENFVDSLNLSIPMKPTQVAVSQLSSIGDSLHSTSLDLGCVSTPVLYQDGPKVHNAKSVDGIRELLLLENGYGKKRAGSHGHSSVASVMLGKPGRHLPVNIMNCVHVTNDYSLL